MGKKIMIILGSILALASDIIICSFSVVFTGFSNGDIAGRRQDELTLEETNSMIKSNNILLTWILVGGAIVAICIIAAFILGIKRNKRSKQIMAGISFSILPVVVFMVILFIPALGLVSILPFIGSVLLLVGLLLERKDIINNLETAIE